MRRILIILGLAALALAATGTASAAQLIDRNATGVKITANSKGEALLTYTKAGAVKHILIWGAENARVPAAGGKQVKFSLDYSGGWGKYHTVYWKTFANTCGQYDGPAIPNMVAKPIIDLLVGVHDLRSARGCFDAGPGLLRLHPVLSTQHIRHRDAFRRDARIQKEGVVKLFRSHRPDYKDGQQLRDFVYVKDVVDVCYFLLHHRKDSGIYNLGSGKARTFLDLVKNTFAGVNKDPNIEFIDTPIDIRDKYQYFTEANMQKLMKAGYKKTFSN